MHDRLAAEARFGVGGQQEGGDLQAAALVHQVGDLFVAGGGLAEVEEEDVGAKEGALEGLKPGDEAFGEA